MYIYISAYTNCIFVLGDAQVVWQVAQVQTPATIDGGRGKMMDMLGKNLRESIHAIHEIYSYASKIWPRTKIK